ncbi:SGNH/GDSL hydrolase family protein [Streptococcus sp. H49]|uniref:SGNH/GDSL hydrolase family protein n=1 Tax=Streptococcus huangxiaojuni TaxID=3237239 RepID=UPI0034A36102
MSKKSLLSGFAFFLVCLLLSFLLLNWLLPRAKSHFSSNDFTASQTQALSYVAIGDSLTEGVGDTTEQGGFVPLLAHSLTSDYQYEVTSSNFGVAGNTSQQILKRMQKEADIQSALAQADLMTLTVGGNDVMAVVRKNLSDLSVDSFTEPAAAYQERLRQIIELARSDNSDLPIYILGIYNPFYLNFPDMTAMQEIVDNWNQTTQDLTQEYDNVYFVAINDLLYKGINGQEGVVQNTGEQSNVVNDALFTGDNFHPNNIGYQIMSDAVMERISETKENW